MIDWEREYAETHGIWGVCYSQDGKYFDSKGQEVFPPELYPNQQKHVEPEQEVKPITEYSKKAEIMAELARLGISFNARKRKNDLYSLFLKVTAEED